MSNVKSLFVILWCFGFGAQLLRAQNTCQSQGGVQVCTIELQNAPNNMEPVAEPTRIRVDDRMQVRFRVTNLSPIDVCSLGGRTPTPTTETNPFESIVTSISGLIGSGLSGTSATQSMAQVNQDMTLESQRVSSRTQAEKLANPNSILDDPKYRAFLNGATSFSRSSQEILVEQKAMQQSLESDMTLLSNYVSADYRGHNWTKFRPKDDPTLSGVRSDFDNVLPSIADAAPSQATLDEMSAWAGDLHKSYDKETDAVTVGTLRQMDLTLAKSKAAMSTLSDYNAALKTAQTTARTSYNALVKVYNDFQRSQSQGIVAKSPDDTFLFQDFLLGTDRKATVTGYVSCVSDVDGKTPTTDQINYSVLYQNVPVLSASVGLLTTFQEKRVIGTTTEFANNSTGYNTIIAVTDSARAQVFPMAYFNVRMGGYLKTHWYRRPEDELDITSHLSAGFGVNPNTGTNQPEFLVGMAFGFNRLMIHPGVHFGRTQSLGGGFTLNGVVPTGYAGPVPINWSYHPAFSIGFSVRVAPW